MAVPGIIRNNKQRAKSAGRQTKHSGPTPGEVMEEREKTRSSSRNWRFLFLACALLDVRNSLKPCGKTRAELHG